MYIWVKILRNRYGLLNVDKSNNTTHHFKQNKYANNSKMIMLYFLILILKDVNIELNNIVSLNSLNFYLAIL